MSTEEFKRKLTAILSADVQGYSHLMGEDEDGTVRTLTAVSLWAAYFGDLEFAMQAMGRGIMKEYSGLFFAWFPVMRDIRQLPGFKVFLKDIGLVDYWNKFGRPDMCHQPDNGDFECD